MMSNHCKQLMAEDKVTSLKAVKNEHH
jgi:hypothetical protein